MGASQSSYDDDTTEYEVEVEEDEEMPVKVWLNIYLSLLGFSGIVESYVDVSWRQNGYYKHGWLSKQQGRRGGRGRWGWI